jgi:multiple sugar transport system substrate-binding protein
VRDRHAGLQIDVMYVPGDYYTKLATLLAAGDPPDLFYLADDYVPQYAELGALLDLTDRVAADADPVVDLADYYPAILVNYRWKGRLYGLPWIAQPVVLYCNDALFREAGVALPDGTWRWNDFVQAGQALTKDRDGDGLADQWGFILNGWPPFQIFAWQNHRDILDPASRNVMLTDPRCVAAAQFYADLIHRFHLAPPVDVVAEQGFSELFRTGKVAMFMGGAADELDSTPGLEVSVHELPAGPDGTKATFAWNAGLHISRTVADPDVAYPVWKSFLQAIGRWKIPSPRRSLAAKIEQFQPAKAPAADAIRASMRFMRPFAVIARQQEWSTILWEQFEEPLLRGMAQADILAPAAQPQLQMLLR